MNCVYRKHYQRASKERGDESRRGKKKSIMTTRNPNSWLSILASLPPSPSEPHLHINNAGSGRFFASLMVHITEMLLLLVAVLGIV
jgi:hypothetical protein